ncbi:MAG: hypothetical protein U9N51_06540 [Bacteroidota bacterium]|nr:hypothetical protein [Bacteroidota bacterium]
MRNLILLIIVFIAFAFFATQCKKIDEFTQFDMDYQTSVTIPSTVGVNLPFDVWTPEVTTNSESQFAVHDTRKDKVEEIILTSTILSVTSPDGGDFAFLNDIYVYLNADNLPEVGIAWKENIPDNAGSEIDLNTSDENLEAYIKQDSIQFRVETVTDRVITQEYDIQIDAVFWVDAKVLGQ